MGYWIPYRQYLRSEIWTRRRAAFYRQAKHCAACLADKEYWFHVHHVSYERLGAELDGDLALFCPRCHEELHRENRFVKDDLESATREFIRYRSQSVYDARRREWRGRQEENRYPVNKAAVERSVHGYRKRGKKRKKKVKIKHS